MMLESAGYGRECVARDQVVNAVTAKYTPVIAAQV